MVFSQVVRPCLSEFDCVHFAPLELQTENDNLVVRNGMLSAVHRLSLSWKDLIRQIEGQRKNQGFGRRR